MKLSPTIIVSLCVAASAFGADASSAPAKKSCCAADSAATAPVAKKHSCCAELEATAYSRDSVYRLDGEFTNDRGARVQLGDLRGRPVVIAMFFASCTKACPMLLSDMTQIRAKLPPELRDRVALVLVSFDAKRDTPEALRAFRESRQLDAQWTLLHANADTVIELAAVLGVKYTLQADGEFAHSNQLTVLNDEGEIVFQRAGLSGDHDRLVEALNGPKANLAKTPRT